MPGQLPLFAFRGIPELLRSNSQASPFTNAKDCSTSKRSYSGMWYFGKKKCVLRIVQSLSETTTSPLTVALLNWRGFYRNGIQFMPAFLLVSIVLNLYASKPL
jgi:hypothetical protein